MNRHFTDIVILELRQDYEEPCSECPEGMRCFGCANALATADELAANLVELGQWKNAARVMAALYGANVHFDGGSWFRDNIEISLDEELPAENIEELLQIAWKSARKGVTESLQTKDTATVSVPCEKWPDSEVEYGVTRKDGSYLCPECDVLSLGTIHRHRLGCSMRHDNSLPKYEQLRNQRDTETGKDKIMEKDNG